jgi:hypothetical protein
LNHTSSESHFCCSDPSSNRSFRPFSLRINLDPFTDWLESKGINPQTAERFEAGLYFGSGFLRGCIGVRLHDINGHPLGYAGRRLDPEQVKTHGKWKFPPGLPKMKILYNFHPIRPQLKKALVIVEGPWAVMRLAQLNIPAIALLGINLSPTLHGLFRQTLQVILMLDGDRTGQRATGKLFILSNQLPRSTTYIFHQTLILMTSIMIPFLRS